MNIYEEYMERKIILASVEFTKNEGTHEMSMGFIVPCS